MNDGVVGLAFKKPKNSPALAYVDHQAIAEVIREALLSSGLGQRNPRVPMADIVQPGMTVLIKPNWVLHYNQGGHGMECMVTHPTFLLAALREVAAAKPARVIIGDAPIQGCSFNDIVTADLRRAATEVCQQCDVQFVDFRRTVLTNSILAEGVQRNARDEEHYTQFDLGQDSLLESISVPEGRFRVTMYDPRALNDAHRPGHHKYLLCREAFEADVIISLPKLKTHRKAGLTGALKNSVGLNGNKDFLPHHRLGGSASGGDCYPGLSPLKHLAEVTFDVANRHIGTPANRAWMSTAYRLLHLHRYIGGDAEIEGGWYGNNTVWRTVLDLNRILMYGRADGTMSDVPQRQIWSLTDAIICGEAEGPLCPMPLQVGAVTFSGSPTLADVVHAALLRLDAERVPMLKQAFGRFRWPLVSESCVVSVYMLAGDRISPLQVAKDYGLNAVPPRNWIGHCELGELPA